MVVGIGGFMPRAWRPGAYTTGVSVLHDRNPLFRRPVGWRVRNGYTVRVINKRGTARRFVLGLEGLPGARLEVVGAAATSSLPADATREYRVLVFAPPGSTARPRSPSASPIRPPARPPWRRTTSRHRETMQARPVSPFRLTGRHVLLAFVGFFATIAAADAVLVSSALRTFTGLEAASPYHADRSTPRNSPAPGPRAPGTGGSTARSRGTGPARA